MTPLEKGNFNRYYLLVLSRHWKTAQMILSITGRGYIMAWRTKVSVLICLRKNFPNWREDKFVRIFFLQNRYLEYSHVKSKFKSLFFWAAFFFLFICLMFWGIGIFIVNSIFPNDYYDDLIYNVFCITSYLLIALYLIFSVLIFTNKFPQKIKQFEKFRYLSAMFILLLAEITVIGTALPDLD